MLRLGHSIVDFLHPKGFWITYLSGNGLYTILLFKQALSVWQDGEMVEVGADSCIFYEPTARMAYCNDTAAYYHDGVFVEGEELGALAQKLGIPINTPFPVSNAKEISALIKDITTEKIAGGRHSEEIIDLQLRLLCYKLADGICYGERNYSRGYFRQFQELRRDIFRLPERDWRAELLAADFHLSLSRFQHLYKEMFSSTLKQDLIQSRMGHAKYLLRSGNRTVSDIAAACGYNSAEHFLRQFRKHTGLTPGSYRREYGAMLF